MYFAQIMELRPSGARPYVSHVVCLCSRPILILCMSICWFQAFSSMVGIGPPSPRWWGQKPCHSARTSTLTTRRGRNWMRFCSSIKWNRWVPGHFLWVVFASQVRHSCFFVHNQAVKMVSGFLLHPPGCLYLVCVCFHPGERAKGPP